ncbi:hypothetical protein AXF14_00195 [Actinomyces radicidentis]|uniref:Polyketide cyclase n=1 Tax=Actinomyces radicidentis TaxID=111015 RepID=A0A0X8JDB1_ACTRD|nr:hypothetical protein [Actinomyces radicidentis]AMD86323.1 hypothetical protein AXF14_00195 [Actinomyces radicidentis]
MTVTTTIVASAGLERVTAAVLRAVEASGWRAAPAQEPTTGGGTLLTIERGSRLRSLLVGAHAGDSFHVRETLLLTREGPSPDEGAEGARTTIVYRTSDGRSALLGGPYGAQHELDAYTRTLERIEVELRRDGLAVGRL